MLRIIGSKNTPSPGRSNLSRTSFLNRAEQGVTGRFSGFTDSPFYQAVRELQAVVRSLMAAARGEPAETIVRRIEDVCALREQAAARERGKRQRPG